MKINNEDWSKRPWREAAETGEGGMKEREGREAGWGYGEWEMTAEDEIKIIRTFYSWL